MLTPTKSADVLVLGELLVDCISHEYVEHLAEARTFAIYQGGSPANVCANLQWLGRPTKLVACVGEDGLGDYLLECLRILDLDLSCITRSPLPTSMVMVGRSQGTPDFIPYRLADTQLPEIPEGLIAASQILHTSAFALSRDPARSRILEAFRKGLVKHKLLSVDWNYAAKVWGQENATQVWNELATFNLLLKISEDDLTRFTGTPFELSRAKAFLDDFPAQVICLTCGKDGVWFRQHREWNYLPAIPIDRVVDTTGAGDAFWAGFLNQWLHQPEVASAVAAGLELASQKISKLGPLYRSE